MNREELRDYVEEQRNLNSIPYHVYSALIDGIDTLEQEPCDDAISRQAVLDCLTATGLKKFDFILDARNKIKNLSSVNPQELKTGHWIYSGSHDVEGMLYCSKCKHKIDVSEGYFNFCPNCGAKMVEPQESEGKE